MKLIESLVLIKFFFKFINEITAQKLADSFYVRLFIMHKNLTDSTINHQHIVLQNNFH